MRPYCRSVKYRNAVDFHFITTLRRTIKFVSCNEQRRLTGIFCIAVIHGKQCLTQVDTVTSREAYDYSLRFEHNEEVWKVNCLKFFTDTFGFQSKSKIIRNIRGRRGSTGVVPTDKRRCRPIRPQQDNRGLLLRAGPRMRPYWQIPKFQSNQYVTGMHVGTPNVASWRVGSVSDCLGCSGTPNRGGSIWWLSRMARQQRSLPLSL